MKNHLTIILVLILNISFGQTKSQLKIVDRFKASSNDSIFILKNSAKKEFSYIIEAGLHPQLSEVDSIIFQTDKGEIAGPFETDSLYVWFKIQRVDSSIRMRAGNIWINYNNIGWDNAYLRAKEINTKAIQGEQFDFLCKQYNEDSNKNYECDLGWFYDKTMVPEFSNELKKHKKGEIFIVKTEYGWHVVKVLENSYLDRMTVKASPLYLKK